MRDLVLCGCSRFYAQLDEEAFFHWLQQIRAIKRVDGSGTKLLLQVQDPMDDGSLNDLIALLTRYQAPKQDKKQLAQFCTPANQAWFKDPQKYWFEDIFG